MKDGEIIYLVDKGEDISDYENINKEVDYCPLCNNHIKPIPVMIYYRGELTSDMKDKINVLYTCPNQNCKELFMATYSKNLGSSYTDSYVLIGYAPFKNKRKEFDKKVLEISPDFSVIYNQAKKAEELKLDEICGMGYRKALEFLIKDYLIKMFPDKEVEIQEKLLWPCIRDYITDVKLKACAQRATWLGNDETHYVKKWKDKDVKDLKMLIDLTIYWIISEELTKEYENDMI